MQFVSIIVRCGNKRSAAVKNECSSRAADLELCEEMGQPRMFDDDG